MLLDALEVGKSSSFEGMSGEIRCRFLKTRYFLWMGYVASTYNLVMISIDRYFEIVHAVFYKTHIKRWIICVMLMLPHLLSGIYNLMSVIHARVKRGICAEFDGMSHQWEFVAMGIGAFVFSFAIPIAILCICYVCIGYFLQKSPGVKSSRSNSKTKLNVIKTLAIVCIVFLLCWIWNSVLFLLFSIDAVTINFDGSFYHFTVTAVNINCIVNPVIYAFKYEQFKREVGKLFNLRSNAINPLTEASASQNNPITIVVQEASRRD